MKHSVFSALESSSHIFLFESVTLLSCWSNQPYSPKAQVLWASDNLSSQNFYYAFLFLNWYFEVFFLIFNFILIIMMLAKFLNSLVLGGL